MTFKQLQDLYKENLINDLSGKRLEVKTDLGLNSILKTHLRESDRGYQEYISKVSELLIKEYNFYREHAMPEIKRDLETVNSNMAKERAKATGDVELFKIYIPDYVQEYISEKKILERNITFNDFPVIKTNVGIKELTQNVVDTAIEVLPSDFDTILTKEFVNNIFKTYLENMVDGMYELEAYKDSLSSINSKMKLDTMYVLRYILENLEDKFMDYLKGDLNDIRVVVKYMIGNIDNLIMYIYNRYNLHKRDKVVIYNMNQTKEFIAVHDYVLDLYLEEGGNLNAVYGVYYSKSVYRTKDQLLKNQDTLLDIYRDRKDEMRLKTLRNEASMVRSVLLNLFTNEIVKDNQKDKVSDKLKEMRTWMAKKKDAELLDYVPVVEEFYVNIQYPESNLDVFIKTIKKYAKETNPQIAATLALNEILCMFLTKDLEIKKV